MDDKNNDNISNPGDYASFEDSFNETEGDEVRIDENDVIEFYDRETEEGIETLEDDEDAFDAFIDKLCSWFNISEEKRESLKDYARYYRGLSQDGLDALLGAVRDVFMLP